MEVDELLKGYPLGCDAMQSGICLPVFERNILPPRIKE
jgi:hypothetical protein